MAESVPEGRWVWYIVLSRSQPLAGESPIIVLDYLDGHVYQVIDAIG